MQAMMKMRRSLWLTWRRQLKDSYKNIQ